MGDYRLDATTFEQYAQLARQQAQWVQQAYQNIQGLGTGCLPPSGIFDITYNPLPTTPNEPEEFRWLRRRVEEVMLNL